MEQENARGIVRPPEPVRIVARKKYTDLKVPCRFRNREIGRQIMFGLDQIGKNIATRIDIWCLILDTVNSYGTGTWSISLVGTSFRDADSDDVNNRFRADVNNF